MAVWSCSAVSDLNSSFRKQRNHYRILSWFVIFVYGLFVLETGNSSSQVKAS